MLKTVLPLVVILVTAGGAPVNEEDDRGILDILGGGSGSGSHEASSSILPTLALLGNTSVYGLQINIGTKLHLKL